MTEKLYDQAKKEIESLKQENQELLFRDNKLKQQIKELEKELISKELTSKPTKKPLPEFKFYERRVEQRRKKNIPIEVDRRSGQDRRRGLRYVRPEFEMIFSDFYPRDKIVHPLILKSDSNKILDAYWELWHVILGYDLKKIKNIRDIYIYPKTRDDILKTVDDKGFFKKGIVVTRSGGGLVYLDSIFLKDPENKDQYYVFIIVDQFQEG